MTATNIKLGIGIMLFITWVLLVVLKVPGAEDLIAAIKLALAGLGAYHLNDRANAPAAMVQGESIILSQPPTPPVNVSVGQK